MKDKPPNVRKGLNKSDVDRLIEECCFAEEYAKILRLLVRKASIVHIADSVGLSTATVDRRIREIKNKINLAYDGNLTVS